MKEIYKIIIGIVGIVIGFTILITYFETPSLYYGEYSIKQGYTLTENEFGNRGNIKEEFVIKTTIYKTDHIHSNVKHFKGYGDEQDIEQIRAKQKQQALSFIKRLNKLDNNFN